MFQQQTEEVLNFLKEEGILNIGGFGKLRGANNPTPIGFDYHKLYQPYAATFVAQKMADRIFTLASLDEIKIACSVQGNVIAYEVARTLHAPLLMLNYLNGPYYPKENEKIWFIRDVVETGRGSGRSIEKIVQRENYEINVMCAFDYRMHLSTNVFAGIKTGDGEEKRGGIQIRSLLNINHLAQTEPIVEEWVQANKNLFGTGNRYIPKK